MKKKIFLVILSVLIIAGLTACSTANKDVAGTTESTVTTTVTAESTTENTTEKETAKSETAAKKSSNSDTTTKPAEQKSAGQTTTKKVTTTQQQTTTEKHTTTKKVTTTQKPTTTKKVTTEFEWDCNVDGHSCEVGPIGWVNSFDEATDKALEYIANHDASGNFRVMQCHMCGKYTAEITLR